MHYFFLLFIISALTGCMVGPDFHSPHGPRVHNYTETPLPAKTVNTPSVGKGGKAQHFVTNQDIPGKWWYLFHSPAIDCLVRAGLAHSPNLGAAQAALRQAKENYYAQIGSTLFPAVTLQPTAERQRFAGASFGGDIPSSMFDLYNVSVNVTYTLDFFGGARRSIEALRAQIDYQGFQLRAAYLSLTSNIVTTAITIASLEAQIKATHQLIKLQQDQLNIIKKQFQLGGVSGSDVFTQAAQVAQTRGTLPPLEQSLSQSRHALSMLVGELPSQTHFPEIDLDTLYLPTELPVSLPSVLARQRPDIRASEALLHAASAQIGVATANMYPKISLTGAYGWENQTPANLFNFQNTAWNFGGSILQPIFNAGALLQKKRAAVDAYQQALAQYRQTILQGFQNVADTLKALEHDAQALRAQREYEMASLKSMNILREQYHLGGIPFINLLIEERQYQQAKISRIQAQAARYNDTAALFQALGGGWWNSGCEVPVHG